MKKKYAFHPEQYAVGQTEKYYADMAARGWILEKRGVHLSRFRRGEPQRLRYRIELSPSASPDEQGLPDEQIALYEDCGWRYVTSAGLINVFCAPESSDAPEFYTDPRQQAATLKALRRSYRLGWLPIVLVLGLYLLLTASVRGSLSGVLDGWGCEIRLRWVRVTSVMLLWLLLLVQGIYQLVRGAVCTTLLYRRLKSGRPIDHSPGSRPVVHRTVNGLLNGLCLLCVVLTAVQLCTIKRYDMPAAADGPYLVLRDMGWEGERTTNYLEKPSTVEKTRSLAARQWYTYECVESGADAAVWMYQDVYQMTSHARAMDLVPVLMRRAVFTREPESFEPAEVPGLDAAWRCGMESIAVRGDTVWFITYADPGLYGPDGPQGDPLHALARKMGGE